MKIMLKTLIIFSNSLKMFQNKTSAFHFEPKWYRLETISFKFKQVSNSTPKLYTNVV